MTGPLRIGLVCPYSLTIPGGVQEQVLGLARALRAKGHAARVLAPCDGAPPGPGITPLGKSVPTSTNGSVAPIAPDPSCALRTIRALRDESFDVVHVHEPLVPGPSLTTLLFTDRPVIGVFHRAGASSAYQLAKPAVRRVARRITLRAAVSPDARDTAHAALGGEYELVYNGVELDRYRPDTVAGCRPRAVLFLGRHEERKGLSVLLDAVADVPGEVEFWIGGDGPQTAALRSRTVDDHRVRWLGRIDDAEKVRRLRAASVFCAPSLRGESFGVVLLEAMAAGAAVVASELPGYARVARPGVDGVLVPPGDPRALAAALDHVLADEALRERLVRAGAERAATFSMDALADRYVELSERVLAGAAR